ncbi:MAG: caspase family protein [Pseudomonadota bacterium]
MRYLFPILIALFLSISGEAQTKRAFVVGVQNYDELQPLSKTLSDADGYASVFESQLGFEVTLLKDPNFSDFLIALSDFEASIQAGDEIAFVFSGHGWSDGARNFVAMRDAPFRSTEVVLERLTFDLNEAIINKFRAKDPSLVLAIVDACRDNPFDLGTKSVTKGLVPQQTIPGTLVVYAAGASQQALDRLDPEDPSPYSVFTRTLLPKLENAGTPLMRAFDEARSETAYLAGQISHLQRPAIYSDVSLDYCFAMVCDTDSAQQRPDEVTQRTDFLEAYRAQLQDRATFGDYIPDPPIAVGDIQILESADLDGDGYQDYYAMVENINFCGSGGCMHEITLYDEGNYRQILANSGGSFMVLPTQQNGVFDIALGSGQTIDRETIYELQRFDGEAYKTELRVGCSLLVTYCGLPQTFEDAAFGDDTQKMRFFPVEDEDAIRARIDQSQFFNSLEVAVTGGTGDVVGDMVDYIAGVDATNQYALVHVWKGTYGVARLIP